MSNPTPDTSMPSEQKSQKRRSLSSYVKRISSVFRRGSKKDAGSSSATAPATTAPAIPSETRPTEATTAADSAAPPATKEPELVSPSADPKSTPGWYARNQIKQDRARALFAKYGLTLEAHELITTTTTPDDVQRVEKAIRMRVHRTCHKCQTTFGAERTCKSCEHYRCKKCPRFPAKKDKKGKAKDVLAWDDGARPEGVTKGGDEQKLRTRNYLSIKSKAGTDLVYQPPKQRVRRMCHKCDTLFDSPTAAECPGCHHVRCTKCPREPAKTTKWPEGYPGDAVYTSEEEDYPGINRRWRKSRLRVRWTCCSCEALFTEGIKTCSACSHARCDTCTRIPPKKVKKEFDPAVVASVEAKLARFRIERDSTPTTT